MNGPVIERFITISHDTGVITFDRTDIKRIEVRSSPGNFPTLLIAYVGGVVEFVSYSGMRLPDRGLSLCRDYHAELLRALGDDDYTYVRLDDMGRIASRIPAPIDIKAITNEV